MQKHSFQLLVFIVKYIILSIILLYYQPSLLSLHLYEQTHFFITADVSLEIITVKICMNGNFSETWREGGTLLEHRCFFVYMSVLCVAGRLVKWNLLR